MNEQKRKKARDASRVYRSRLTKQKVSDNNKKYRAAKREYYARRKVNDPAWYRSYLDRNTAAKKVRQLKKYLAAEEAENSRPGFCQGCGIFLRGKPDKKCPECLVAQR